MEKSEEYLDASELTPARPVHPGGLIGEEIRERGVSQKDFAGRIGMQPSQLSAIIHGVRSITPAVAAKLESGFENIPASFWLRLQEKYKVDLQKSKLKSSALVSGYVPAAGASVAALAEPEVGYGECLQFTVTIPARDQEMLNLLASRLGWKVLR